MGNWSDNKPWRMIQTNLRETGMADISAGASADLAEFRPPPCWINAAGIIASYPTKLPYHYQSRFRRATRSWILSPPLPQGIRVLARCDFSRYAGPS